jgi:hypothetical protein
MLARSSPTARETQLVVLGAAAEEASAPHADGKCHAIAAAVPLDTVDFRKFLREVKQPVVIFLILPVTVGKSRRAAFILPIVILR